MNEIDWIVFVVFHAIGNPHILSPLMRTTCIMLQGTSWALLTTLHDEMMYFKRKMGSAPQIF